TAPSDSLAALLDRWSAAVGARAWSASRVGTHMRAHAVTGGVPGTIESWITRDGLRDLVTEGVDHGEWVCRGHEAWQRDWNGRTRALEGRDLGDAVTDAYIRALAYAGPSRLMLRRASPRAAGLDSTGTLQVIRLTPPAGVPFDLFIDPVSARPVRAVRKPY